MGSSTRQRPADAGLSRGERPLPEPGAAACPGRALTGRKPTGNFGKIMALPKRIIPCLDVTAGRVVKGVNFVELRDAGDPVEIARRYDDQGADELTFLDITPT